MCEESLVTSQQKKPKAAEEEKKAPVPSPFSLIGKRSAGSKLADLFKIDMSKAYHADITLDDVPTDF